MEQPPATSPKNRHRPPNYRRAFPPALADRLARLGAGVTLSEAAREAYGRELTIRLVTGPPADGNLTEAARQVPAQVLSRERASSRAQEDPMVQKAMALFRGEVIEIKEKK